MKRARGLISALAIAVAVAGCSASFSSGDKLDSGKLEGEIQSGIEQQLQGVDVSSVSCPDDVEIKTGGTFTCTAIDSQGTSRTVDVTMTDDSGNVHWELAGASQ